MPGKPWQSGGCGTCRRRRVKCDETKPSCARCTKLRIKCLGYRDEGRLFFHQTIEQWQEKSKKSASRSRSRHHAHQLVVPTHVQNGPALRVQIFSSFLNIYFPVDVREVSGPDSWHFMLTGLGMLPKKAEIMDMALSAMASVYLGKTTGDNTLFHHGIGLYNRSIRLFSRMIDRRDFCDDLIYTALVFQELECFYCPHGLQTWIAHVIGTNALIRQYKEYCPPPTNPVMKAIVNKYHKLRTLFTMGISGDEYKYVLDSESDADTPIDELARIYANAAVLNDTFNNIDSSDYDACQNLLHDCLAHREQTLAWYGSRLGVKAGPFECEKGDILCTGLPSTDELFGPPYRFLSLDIARAHFVFWSAMLTIQPFIYHVKAMIRAQTDMGSPIEPSQDDDYLIAGWFADQVVRTMPFCVQDKYKLSGAHILIFLTGQIAKIYNDLGYARKMAWCLEAYGLLANLGFNAGNHLKELVWEQWGNAHKSDLNTSVKEESRRSVRGHGVPALQIAQCSLDLQSLKTLAIPDIIFLPAPEPTSLDIPEITGPCQ